MPENCGGISGVVAKLRGNMVRKWPKIDHIPPHFYSGRISPQFRAPGVASLQFAGSGCPALPGVVAIAHRTTVRRTVLPSATCQAFTVANNDGFAFESDPSAVGKFGERFVDSFSRCTNKLRDFLLSEVVVNSPVAIVLNAEPVG